MKLIAVGDNVVDCYLDQQTYYPGGNCVNVAVNAKKNGAENAAYIGIFGTDEKAEHIKYALKEEAVDFQFSRVAEGLSGQPQVSLTEEGDRVFVGGPKNTVQHKLKLQLVPDELDYISSFDLCHVSCYSSMESELPKLSKVINVSFDFSNRLEIDYVKSVAPYINYAFFSAADLDEDEIDQFIEQVNALNFEVFAMTRGSLPAVFVCNGERLEQKLNPIQVVDTMGAGDSLIGGFLVNYINGESPEAAIEKATKSAEITCGMYGGFGYPKSF
ncbi:PfkB family carbohydrate kinase [Planomicrobium sp. CPCC 101079]|uniref:PfkB family carbohydrate kinase n=1 Tax=Planomicrobium sp. CPCC 101079 TaxID=2599618 RepID=UPI0011B371B4|nr:PfkB family carbohydrate kinase [Planomicrobium sp. CPCC 101079]TWT13289.1 carbohydrate kinase [Planomicrobium sp. CPCC 101079]